MTKTADQQNPLFPAHLALIPDGNGRWAERNGLPRLAGHQAGMSNMHRMMDYIFDYPFRYFTLYGFSTENWGRPDTEVAGLFDLVEDFIDAHVQEIHQRNVKFQHLGRLKELPKSLQDSVNNAVKLTKKNTGLVLSVAFNYGGRAEIIDAVRHLIKAGIPPEQIDEKLFADYLYTGGIPDVDLMVRTGNEIRLSNFLIWQTAYAENYYSKVMWPDFTRKDLDKALDAYSQRKRRFGRVHSR